MGYFYGVVPKKVVQGKNSDDIQRQNRGLILKIIKQEKITSRVELAGKSGLRQATISNIIKPLLDMEIVCETELIEGKNGRRVAGICLNQERYCTIIVRITKSYYNIGVYQLANECPYMDKKFIDAFVDFDYTVEEIRQAIKRAMCEVPLLEVLGIGIVLEGEIFRTPSQTETKPIQLSDMPWAQALTGDFNIPVYLDKSVNMAAYWHWIERLRYKRKSHIFIYIQVGYSLECCIMNNGKIISGKNDREGFLSHMVLERDGKACDCGKRGCLCQYVSVEAVRRRVGELQYKYPNSPLGADCNIRDIIKAFGAEDALANKVYAEVAEYLGLVAANLANIFDPDEICFGDEIPVEDRLQDAVRKAFRTYHNGTDETVVNLIKVPRERRLDIAMRGCNQYLFDTLLPGKDFSSKAPIINQ